MCDFETGACVAESAVMYVAPTGSVSATTCTRQAPCELRRVLSLATGIAQLTIRALPGTYTFDGDIFFVDPSEVRLHGAGATFSRGAGSLFFDVDGAAGGVKLHVYDLVFDRAVIAANNAGELSLVRVSAGGDPTTSFITAASGSKTSMFDSHVANTTIQMQDVSTLTVEGSLLTGTIGTYSIGANITVRNSVIVSPLAGSTQHEFMSAVGNGGNLTFESSTLFNTYVARGLLSNSILYSPGIGLPSVMASSVATASYSLVNPQAGAFNGGNNLKNVDPMFVNAATGELHLLAGSPAIDAANPTSTNTIDHDGVARPQNGRNDMGAFEHTP
ncbi:MAG: hypothetical protein NT062_00540 [Proteobacteria bacterium]|nr:hypothetical protein [Pseudomonadota bacterium]